MKKFIVILLTVLMLCSCTKESKHDIAGKTYYNTVDEYGNSEHSKVWFGKDNSFVINDNFFDGSYEISGKWSINENVINLEVEKTGVGEFKTIKFEITDDDNLVLRTALAGSKFADSFTTTKPQPSTDTVKFTHGTYYNITQNSKQRSYVELRADNSFALIDRNDFGIFEFNGTYSQDKNMLSLKCVNDPENRVFDFLISDAKTLILQNDVGVSATGDKFSIDFDPNAENNNTNTNTNTGNVPCTEIKTQYNNYWAYKGVKGFTLGVTLVPSNTTDKVTYTSDNLAVVEIDQNGVCSAVGGGTTKIHIKCGNVEKVVNFETRDPDTTFTDFGTYYNETGCMQYIELKKDGKFKLVDNIAGDFVEVSGLYSREKDVLMFSNFESFKDQNGKAVNNFVFKIKDNETIILLNDLHGSVTNNVFKKMSEGPICGIEFDDSSAGTRYVYTGASAADTQPQFLPYFELYNDQTFLFYENLFAAMGSYTGKCSFMGSNMSCKVEKIDFSGFAGDNVKEINFTFKDDNTIILKTDLCMSLTGDEFKIQ